VTNARYYNVYRTNVNAPAATAKFICRVISAGATTNFVDLGNKKPGSSTGFLVQKDTMGFKELAPYSRMKLAVTDLSVPEAFYRFCSLAVYQPRKNTLLTNVTGSF
jgi:hypothetical protein